MPNWILDETGVTEVVSRQVIYSNDPDAFSAGFLGLGAGNSSGEVVTEPTTLTSSAWFRGVSVLASTIASLPLVSYRTADDMARSVVASMFDDPCPGYFTPFEWVELIMIHLVLHGNAYLLHLYSNAGVLVGLFPIHPSMIQVRWAYDQNGNITGKIFSTTLNTVTPDGRLLEFDQTQMTQIMGMGADGLKGYSLIRMASNSIGTTIAGDQAAARMFGNGMLIGGLVTTDGTMTEEDGKEAMAGLKSKLTGSKNAGDIALVNAALKFSPWTMSADDAQFIESRQFQVEEASRWLGVPKVLMSEDGASSWGTGIGQLLAFMQKTTFMGWTTRIQQRLSLMLSKPRHTEFEYSGLLKGTPLEETQLLAAQIDAGIITIDEARAKLNLPPMPKVAFPPPSELTPLEPAGQAPATTTEGP